MGFQFKPERSIFSHDGFYQDGSDEDSTNIAVMKVILWSQIFLSGKIATLMYGESVDIALQ